MDGFKEHTITTLKGTLGDGEADWWTEKDWENHRKYVEELKASGEYLQPQEVTLMVKPNPIFDIDEVKRRGVGEYEIRFVLLDMSK